VGARGGTPGGKVERTPGTFPEGVASADPDHHSVILWTRVADPAVDKSCVEVAEDERFTKILNASGTN
jgi:phosphodiesterase/alkaline phosphatase D-like protein